MVLEIRPGILDRALNARGENDGTAALKEALSRAGFSPLPQVSELVTRCSRYI